jgi:hypothetical protein
MGNFPLVSPSTGKLRGRVKTLRSKTMKRLFMVLVVFIAVCAAVIALNMHGTGPW